MLGQTFYHGLVRKYVVAFGNLFNDITVERKDLNYDRVQTIGVPIAYGPKEKYLVRLRRDPNLDQDVAITLPRISFEINSFMYDPQRVFNSTRKNVFLHSDNNRAKSQYVPVPYNLNFVMAIMVENADDGCQILEQILPYFRPEFTTAVNLVPEMEIVRDTPVILTSVTLDDTYDGDFETRRALIYNLDFMVKGWMFGPVSNSGVIKRAIVNFYDGVEADSPQMEQMIVQPAQYANGAPLFSPSANAALSVDVNAISANSDYGFSVSINTDYASIEDAS